MDHMITSMRMEEEPSHMTERILDLTLEIIYLVTGEVRRILGDHMTSLLVFCSSPLIEICCSEDNVY